MAETKKYSLWLIPTGDIYNKLANLISQLSEKYSAPHFDPHVTLLSQVAGVEDKIVSKTSQLAKLVKPYKIKLTTIDYLDEYFRSLFIKIKETEEVMNANIKAREIFSEYIIDRHADTKYTPHLSLLYGNFPSQVKKEIIKETGKEFNISFEIKSIHLFFTEGEVKDWYKIKEFPLSY